MIDMLKIEPETTVQKKTTISLSEGTIYSAFTVEMRQTTVHIKADFSQVISSFEQSSCTVSSGLIERLRGKIKRKDIVAR